MKASRMKRKGLRKNDRPLFRITNGSNGLGLSDAGPQPQTEQDATPLWGRRLTSLQGGNRSDDAGAR